MRFLKLSLVFLVLFTTPAFAEINFPAFTGRVVDDAHVLSPQAIRGLQVTLWSFQRATSVQLIVVTVPSLQGLPIFDYSVSLWKAWGGIGEKSKNNGVLFLIAPNEKLARISTGYGVEGILTDSLCGAIIQQVVLPNLKDGHIEKGISDGVRSIIELRPATDPPNLDPAAIGNQPVLFTENVSDAELNGIKPFLYIDAQSGTYIILFTFLITGGLILVFNPIFYLRVPLLYKFRMWCANLYKRCQNGTRQT